MIFDAYEYRARVLPAILVALPIAVALWCTLSLKDITLGGSTATGIVSLAVVYILSTLVATKGKELEPLLVKKWGGLPSTIIMRWRDDRVGKDLKSKYHEAVKSFLNLPVSSAEEELADPLTADRRIEQAFGRVRGLLREHNPTGMWFRNNCDYGFQRNLLGCRIVWLCVAAVSAFVTGIVAYFVPGRLILAGLVTNALLLAAILYFGWSVLPKSVELTALRYAYSAWEAFLNIATSKRGNHEQIQDSWGKLWKSRSLTWSMDSVRISLQTIAM